MLEDGYEVTTLLLYVAFHLWKVENSLNCHRRFQLDSYSYSYWPAFASLFCTALLVVNPIIKELLLKLQHGSKLIYTHTDTHTQIYTQNYVCVSLCFNMGMWFFWLIRLNANQTLLSHNLSQFFDFTSLMILCNT